MTCVKEILTLFLCLSTIANTLPINLQKVKKDVTSTVDSDELASAATTVETYSSTVYTAVEPVFNIESSSDTATSSSTSESTTTHRARYSNAITAVSSSASSTSGSTTTIAPSSSTDGSSSDVFSSSSSSSISTDNYDVTTLLSKTASTDTGILFTATTTTAAGISGLTGTTVIPDIGIANPSTSITLVSSSLTVTIDPSTFTSAKTITSSPTSTGSSTTVTMTQATAVSTSKITSESVSETTMTYNTVSESTTTKTVSYSNNTFTTTSTSTTIYATSIATSSSTVAVTTASVASSTYTTTATVAASGTVDLFSAIATDAVPTSFPTISNEWDFNDNVDWTEKSQGQTNKFYINLLLDDAAYPAFVYPYLMWQSTSSLYGFAVQHTTSADCTFDQYMDNGDPRIFTNPLNEYDLVFSSASFASASDFYMDISNLTPSSTLVTLTDSSDTSSYVQLPIVEGMGFVTAIYNGDLIPSLYSGMNIQSLASETSSSLAEGVSKYRTYINDVAWLIYVTNPLNDDSFSFSTAYGAGNGYSIVGNVAVDGLIVQATVAPSSTDDEVYFDEAAGMYVTSMDIVGTSDGLTSTYYYNFQTEGASASGSPIVYILAHQLDAVSSNSDGANTGVTLAAVTRGVATAFLTASIEFTETLNTEIGWLPWSAQLGSTKLSYSADLIQQLATAAKSELSVDIWTTIESLNSYYLGKVIDKYAYITLVCADIIEDSSLTASALDNLKTAFNNLIADDGYFVYDDKFGGIITNNDWDSITDTSDDFGNSHYNDHHFHYGYIIHAAAVLGYVDSQNGGTWATDNKDWVNSLIRDVANPSSDDTYFPVSRYFDWFTGHSWASGLYYNINGLNEESTSEDYNFLYGMKMWGQLIGDDSMQYRADTMIQIMTRALNTYFYFEDSNTIMPSEIIPNKVAGISFQNYLDYTTYFGDDSSYIHGIHMLPLTPLSGQMRSEVFVTEEWDDILAADIDSASGGWRGILRLNQALVDPNTSYAFFSASDASDYLDNGMSLTWSLAFSGGLAYSLGLL
ncbi:hypothetical protein HANVADRAFT_53066 [Hanseniaspora valbyensis NRRL Y-1626]|uniref:glucan endo-1,3-beta-D-glucosidase n=1 Tax=Hanseniaspora valbyensis NRRL Y-1626 TaxID=766949 RepID=A0A1B7TCI1_9ASCO|nr:hypothetical protein HANVADRAFT_53066 [Hanseniaspora valbyensis NRRL Y-1626]